MDDRLAQQIEFIVEIDKIKAIVRRTRLFNDSRYENDAEHAWHLSMMAMVLREHANEPVLDVGKVIRMVLVHDLVEIDAGDTFLYDEEGMKDKKERECKAAERLFGMLPEQQGEEFRGLWEEFEARATPEARFASALDRLEPILQNLRTRGHAWQKHGVKRSQVERMNRKIAEGSERLWQYVQRQLDQAVERGILEE
jgi:putative hydrolase of HD superfamily